VGFVGGLEKMKLKGLVGPLIGLMVAIIIAVAVVIPVAVEVIGDTNFTGYETTETVAQLFPLLVAVLVLVGIAGYMTLTR
jgi:hypothetical protein